MSKGSAFFDNPETDAEDFISQMKQPREEIETPSMELPGEDIEEEVQEPEDREMLDALDYTEEHRFTAEFLLIQMDKIIGFGLGVFSGEDSDKYRRRINRIQGEDYEAQLLAALIKKYQMRLSLEWMFASAMLIAYAPAFDQALKDRRAKVKAEQEAARQEYMEFLRAQAAAEAVVNNQRTVSINATQRRSSDDSDGQKRDR